ncbi:hypothetical protein AB0A81_01200 [Streptomyces flaveolus]|uniref:Lipoprotein n=1 Tax=Streptomyces flaveolus TaxID=67297 RepID=A0ABV1VGM5_9ACTN
MPTPSSGRSRWYATAAACTLVLTLAGCNPHMYDDVPAPRDVRRTDVMGSWDGYDRTHVVLRPDGTADIRLLDGQEFDFDDRWRVSGTGRWALTDEPAGWNDGPHVRLTLASRAASATRTPAPDEPPAAAETPEAAPPAYTWTFELRRDDGDALELYFFFGDPDSRSTYVLQRARPQAVSAHITPPAASPRRAGPPAGGRRSASRSRRR